ncbi:MAG: hypothetical protein RKE49_14955 [Oceanicaulis sp.]
MGIREEMERQEKARKQEAEAKAGAPEKARNALAPLIETLEGQREPEFRKYGAFVFDPSQAAWVVRFPSLWSGDDPRRTKRSVAIADSRSPWHTIKKTDGMFSLQQRIERDTSTGVYKIEHEEDGRIQISVQRFFAEEPVPKSVRVWERFDRIGVFSDHDAAFEAFFPIYARAVANAETDITENEALGAQIDAWLAKDRAGPAAAPGSDGALDEATRAAFADVFGDAFARKDSLFACPRCGQGHRLNNAPKTGLLEVNCAGCKTPFRIKDGAVMAQETPAARTRANAGYMAVSIITLIAVAAGAFFLLNQ